jgi:hypothetical protein
VPELVPLNVVLEMVSVDPDTDQVVVPDESDPEVTVNVIFEPLTDKVPLAWSATAPPLVTLSV